MNPKLTFFLFFLTAFTCAAQEIPSFPQPLKVAGIADRPPAEFSNSEGKPDGILPDLWKLWSEQTGIPLDYHLFSRKEALTLLLSGQVHVISGISPESDSNLVFSAPYHKTDIRIFTLNKEKRIQSPQDLTAFRVGVVRGDQTEKYLQKNMPMLAPAPFSHARYLAEALASREIRAAVGDTDELLFWLGHYAAGGRIRYLPDILFSPDICAAVSEEKAFLLPVISQGFAEIDPEKKQAVIRSRTGFSIGHRIPWHLFSIGILMLIFILAALGFWIWNEQLRARVEAATADLREKQQQLLDSEKALRTSQESYKRLYEDTYNDREVYRSLLNSSADAIAICDLNETVRYINPSFIRMFGWTTEELEGRALPFVPEEEFRHNRQMIQDIISHNTACQGIAASRLAKDGHVIEVSISASLYADHEGKAAGILMILRDMSETRKLEARLRQAQKMEAIGTLSGGIAHDFNNILSAIIGYTEIARLHVPEPGKTKDSLEKVIQAGNRARELIRQILSFSRQTQGNLSPIRLAPVVKEALKLIRASLPSTIRIAHQFDSSLKYVNANPVEIHQIIMNLCTNAHHAMRKKGGLLRVSMEKLEISAEKPDQYPGMKPGIWQQISVSDTGHGIEKSIMEKIFDPYFTTKPRDEGTGIGLSVVHGIVKRHGGIIAVESQPGRGTVFRVCFPQLDYMSEEKTSDSKKKSVSGTESSSADDEQFLILKEILSGMGYKVTAVNDSAEALHLFSQSPDQFDVLVTDMTMPGMTGTDLAEEIRKIRPGIPIILCTGYSETVTADMAAEMGIREFFMKPINYYDLARAIRKLCEEN
ncbi:MAG: transporter substrate-binding domain-containing protein [Desulfobacterales bacterium]